MAQLVQLGRLDPWVRQKVQLGLLDLWVLFRQAQSDLLVPSAQRVQFPLFQSDLSDQWDL